MAVVITRAVMVRVRAVKDTAVVVKAMVAVARVMARAVKATVAVVKVMARAVKVTVADKVVVVMARVVRDMAAARAMVTDKADRDRATAKAREDKAVVWGLDRVEVAMVRVWVSQDEDKVWGPVRAEV